MSTVPPLRHKTIVACGKFQPFHTEHLEYIVGAAELGHRLVVGITNPDPIDTRLELADPARSRPESNPATYYERLLMVKRSAIAAGIPPEKIDIVPFPLSEPDRWAHYIPSDATFVLTLYSDDPWLDVRRKKFEDYGSDVLVLWAREKKGITGTEVRRRIAHGLPWRELVPEGTASVIREFGIEERIQHAYGQRGPADD